MIYVEYDRKHNKVKVVGHAGSGEPGKDLVCSAASILVYTLAENAESISQDHMRYTKPVIEIEEGKAKIECNPVKSAKHITTFLFDTLMTGFSILHDKYPEYVTVTVKG